jgi:hypothetical protein
MVAALPTMQRYLEALPKGLDSYPECQQKASVLRNFFEGTPTQELTASLPPAVAQLVKSPPPASEWVSEVHTTAAFMASADCLFRGPLFVHHAYTTNYALLDSTMYRVLFRLAGQRRLLSKAADNWSMFHRGTKLTLERIDEGLRKATLVITAPPKHIPPLLAEGYGTALRAAVEISGATHTRATVSVIDDRAVQLEVSWT